MSDLLQVNITDGLYKYYKTMQQYMQKKMYSTYNTLEPVALAANRLFSMWYCQRQTVCAVDVLPAC